MWVTECGVSGVWRGGPFALSPSHWLGCGHDGRVWGSYLETWDKRQVRRGLSNWTEEASFHRARWTCPAVRDYVQTVAKRGGNWPFLKSSVIWGSLFYKSSGCPISLFRQSVCKLLLLLPRNIFVFQFPGPPSHPCATYLLFPRPSCSRGCLLSWATCRPPAVRSWQVPSSCLQFPLLHNSVSNSFNTVNFLTVLLFIRTRVCRSTQLAFVDWLVPWGSNVK